MSSNLVAETSMMELKESDTVTQEPVILKIFVETTLHTETTETQEMAVQTEDETVETHEMEVHPKAETVEIQEVAVQTEEEEAMDHILDVET